MEAVSTQCPSGLNASASMSLVCPLSSRTGCPSLASQSRTLSSVLALAISVIVTQFVRRRRAAFNLRDIPAYDAMPQMIGAAGQVLEWDGRQGWAEVDGERWQVRAGRELRAGDRVRVARVDGLVLEVNAMGGESEGA